MPKTTTRFPLKASVLALAMAGGPLLANAAGIGKLTVLSALGQPLRAEIELSATKDELSSLSAKVANQEQFRQQGMEYGVAASALNLSIEKRANGQPYVRVSSDRPLNEPYLDILVELTWASGRLMREYTFLLDPVELPRPTGASVLTPGVNPVGTPNAPTVTDTSKSTKGGKTAKSIAAPKAEAAPKPEPAPKPVPAPKAEPAAKPTAATPSEGGTTREIKRGDTLGKIAAETAPEGVSLDQMLVALYSTNRDAFIGDNLNRLRTGKILSVPDRDAAAAISETEARKTVSLHARNFNAYRKQLAEAAAASGAAEASAAQQSSGKITPKVEDRAPAPATGKDKLEVSRSENAKDGGKASKAAAEEDRVAREKALKEAEARVAALEKNVSDLKQLNEIKSKALAEAEKKATAKPEVAKEAAKPAEVAKPEAPKPETAKAETPAPESKSAAPEVKPAEPVAPPQATEAAKPQEKPAEVTAPDAQATPPADKPAPPPKKKVFVPPPEPEPEPTFMEEFGSFVYLGLAALLSLGGFFGFREYKRRKALEPATGSQFDEPSSTSSVFGTTGGQSVDTNNVSLASGFSQTSLTGNEGTAGVDPVAEAEVYMAYGRDAQAEEILLEAIKAEPTRQAVHLKLLELYAARKSVKPFEEVAKALKQQTGGIGANWDRAAALGKGIDPANPLYGDARSPAETMNMDTFGTSTVIMPPGQLAKMAAMDPAKAETLVMPAVEPAPEPAAEEEVQSFDLDLGDEPASISAPEPAPVTLDFDLDLGSGATTAAATTNAPTALDIEVPSISPAEAPAAPAMDIEFDLGLPATTPAAAAPAPAVGNSVDFDFNLDTPAASAPEPGAIKPAVNFSDINLDLEPPAAAAAPASADTPSSEEDNPEVSTKLELAQAYEEMGDTEGMRELLQEVLGEGSAAQQETARSKLAQHGF